MIEQTLSLAKIRLLDRHPFFGYVVLSADIKLTDDVEVAGVDGVYMYVNSDAFIAMRPQHQMSVLAHETMHIALQHVQRRQWRDADKWNVAADIVTNEILLQQGMELLPDAWTRDAAKKLGVDVPRVDDTTVEGVYEMLPNGILPAPTDLLDENEGGGGNKARWKAILSGAAEQAQKRIGVIPGWLQRYVDVYAPVVSWQLLLSQFTASLRNEWRSWRRLQRRQLWSGTLAAGQACDRMLLVVAVDTSGSISSSELGQFVAEINAVSGEDNTVVLALQFDIVVTSSEWLSDEQPLTVALVGGGGTNFRSVFDYIEEKQLVPDGVVFLTDGYGTYPEESEWPTMWVLTEDHFEPPWGWAVAMGE
uniref:Putative hydrolase n=1 Tax=viral metagenome TaxID=1070528 RepID=A0A6M3K9G8_9ZZZZ